jgi:hypothetical protein
MFSHMTNETSPLLSARIQEFPVTVGEAIQEFMRISIGTTGVLYHYTTRAGLEGILRDGGLRAMYRGCMNDGQEFTYARRIIDEVFKEIRELPEIPSLTMRLMDECSVNLDHNEADSHDSVRAFCSCLTVSRDEENHWRDYAEQGKGFALGFDLLEMGRIQKEKLESARPWLCSMPVLYDRERQRDLIGGIVNRAISDVKRFKTHFSPEAEELTAFYHRVLRKAVTMLVACIDFIKHPEREVEREMRTIADPNDGTFDVRDIRYRAGDGVPFLFHDFRDPANGQLPLKEIIIGPNAVLKDEVAFVERLSSDLGLCFVGGVQPRIVGSSLGRWS